MRLILREAVLFFSDPWRGPLSIAETAARTVASLSAAFASMAAFAFLTTVFRLVLMAFVVGLLRSRLHDTVLLRFDVRHSFHLLGYL